MGILCRLPLMFHTWDKSNWTSLTIFIRVTYTMKKEDGDKNKHLLPCITIAKERRNSKFNTLWLNKLTSKAPFWRWTITLSWNKSSSLVYPANWFYTSINFQEKEPKSWKKWKKKDHKRRGENHTLHKLSLVTVLFFFEYIVYFKWKNTVSYMWWQISFEPISLKEMTEKHEFTNTSLTLTSFTWSTATMSYPTNISLTQRFLQQADLVKENK